ncbi:flagellar basal body rod protein FlgB [Dehalobacter sp. DCM]|uniref:flagellar basal body rod protein FlgB n=1 Tax=Dehalobacter sp. DCM TaxID=2907827 RepID=UPI0030814FE2|nr:flagellar basal body rod protein FlgB [Dehalobacter sp. DCM]
MAGWLDSPLFKLMERGLDGTSLRQRVLANNIANNDTPDYKRSDLQFDAYLQAALNDSESTVTTVGTEPGHIPITINKHLTDNYVVQDNHTTYRNDGNNVDIDTEMTRMVENQLQYNALSSMITQHLTLLKQAVSE